MNKRIVIGVVLLSAASFALGYFVGKKREEKKAAIAMDKMARDYAEKTVALYKESEKGSEETDISSDESKTVNVKNPKEENHPKPGNIAYDKFYEVREAEAKTETPERIIVKRPYLINPDEYDDHEDYDPQALFLWADDVVTDDEYNVLSYQEIEEYVGKENLKCFGLKEGEIGYNPESDDEIFVRNDKLKIDYDITKDALRYSDWLKNNQWKH